MTKVLCDVRVAGYWRYTRLWLTGDANSAQEVVHPALPQVWQYPGFSAGAEGSAWVWPLIFAHNITDDRRPGAGFCNVGRLRDVPRPPVRLSPDGVNAAVDRPPKADTIAQLLSGGCRALIACSYCAGCNTIQVATDLNIAGGTRNSPYTRRCGRSDPPRRDQIT